MNPERRALLNDVLAKRDDDAPRLVFADWLDENGEGERAELIRMSIKENSEYCQFDTLKDGNNACNDSDCPKCGIGYLIRERFFSYDGHGWVPTHPEWLPSGLDDYAIWHRGFVCSIRCTAADWLAHADAILAEHPVESVELSGWLRGFNGVAGTLSFYTAMDYLASRWPGIKFALPPNDYRHHYDALRNAVASSMGVQDFIFRND